MTDTILKNWYFQQQQQNYVIKFFFLSKEMRLKCVRDIEILTYS